MFWLLTLKSIKTIY